MRRRQHCREGAVVCFSGGQDSTTCLGYALREYERVEALSLDYGQRHAVELLQAEAIAKRLGVQHTVLSLGILQELGGAALTDDSIDVAADAAGTGNTYAEERGLPSTFVPGRNALIFATAAAFGAPRGLYAVVTGVCQMDDAGYPDCRASFVKAQEGALRLALDLPQFEIDAPLLRRTKGQTFAMAEQHGVLDAVLELSHTCYEGERSPQPWGYGCGECPACKTRAEGWYEYRRHREGVANPAARVWT